MLGKQLTLVIVTLTADNHEGQKLALTCPPHLLTGLLGAVIQTECNSSLMIRRTTSSVTGLLFVATCLSASLIKV